MFAALANAPTSTWVGIMLVALLVAFGLAVCVANEVLRYAAEQAREDEVGHGADGDWPHVPSFKHIHPDTGTEA